MTGSGRDAATSFDPTAELETGTFLLEASAGTGKTHTITSLVLRLVAEHGVDPARILVVTFTRAATAELRDRVRRRLTQGAVAIEARLAHLAGTGSSDVEEPDDPVLRQVADFDGAEGLGPADLEVRLDRVSAARDRFDEMTISTIHGFCHETLSQSAFESDVDLEAELVEDLDELLEEIVHDHITAELRPASPEWYAYLRENGIDRNDLLDVARAVEAEPHLRVLPEGLDRPEGIRVAAAESFRTTWEQHGDEASTWLRERIEAKDLGRKHIYVRNLDDYLEAVAAWCGGADERYPDVIENADSFTPATLRERSRVAVSDSPVWAAFEELCAAHRDAVTAFRVRFARRVGGELDARKLARSILSFNDLLRALRRGLADPENRELLNGVLRERFEVALIDEFQDTDPVQWEIFETVFGDHGRLYLIGDPKQAIYAFRGADVHTYLEAAGAVERRRTLRRNWRSDEVLVRALNAVFEACPIEPDDTTVFGHPRIGYHPVEPVRDQRLHIGGEPASGLEIVHVARELAGVEGTDNIASGWADQHLPAIVADEIVELLRAGATLYDPDEDRVRRLLPRDIAVLTRTNRQAAAVQEALDAVEVHAVASGGGSVYGSAEALVLQRLLSGLLRPHVQRDARAAMTTPVLGVTGPALAAMDEDRWEWWIEQLAAWSATWRDHGIAEAVRRIFDERGSREALLRLPGGERRLTNVLHLLELLHRQERTERTGPSALAAWLRDRRYQPPSDRESAELRLESDEDAVKVVTVHRAKGLEYPVVWCPWLWREEGLRDERTLRFHHPDDGALSLDLRVDGDHPEKQRHVAIAREEQWQENLRLLYVALTRARHRCTIHWGALYGFGVSALGRLLHGWDLDGEKNRPIDDEELRARLDELAGLADGVTVREAATPTGRGFQREENGGGELQARSLTRDLDLTWGRTSYSRLSRREDDHGSDGHRRDVDAGTDPSLRDHAASDHRADADRTAVEVPLARFPRGAAAGTFLHDLLEHLDFTRSGEDDVIAEAIAEQRRRHRLEIPDDVPLVDGLREVLHTPLGPTAGGACLADIPMSDRLNELDFDLPLAGGYRAGRGGAEVGLGAVADLLERYVDDVPVLERYVPQLRSIAERRARGFLTGSIDLVARVPVDGGSRYLVADHKSNWLGDRGLVRDDDRSTVDHYHPDHLAGSMVDHDYVLQALIYLVGLHRLLRWRSGDRYDYEADVGGVLYLFLRGMVGPETPTAADGTPHGIFALTPPRALVEDLDTLLTTGENPR